MLQGKGDGWEQTLLAFKKKNPEIKDQQLLIAQFSHKARYSRFKACRFNMNTLFQKVIIGFIAFAIII